MRRYTEALIAMTLVCLLAGCGGGGKAEEDKAAGEPAAATGVTYYFGARIIPGDGKPAIDNGVFVVENGKITAVAKEGEIRPPRDSGRVELTGYTITPVFTNLHAHPGVSKGGRVSAANYSRESVLADLQRYAYYGVEAVLSAGTDKGDIAFTLRDEQREGKITAARLYTSGRGIVPRGGGPDLGDIPIEVSTPVEAKKAVEDEVARKVDAITIWVDDGMGKSAKMAPEVYKVIVNEAHKNNLKVFAHVFSLADAKALVAAGVDGLLQSIRDREVDDELIADMKSKNVFLTPTLTAHEAKFVYAEKTDWLGEQLMRETYPPGLSAYLRDQVTMNRFRRNPELAALKQQHAMAMSNLKKMAAAGVKIALGSDSGSADTFPGYFDLREMMMMVQGGMSPMDVIAASTSVPGEILGSDVGAIAVGKSANFLTFSNNPAEKIENLKSMGQLYIRGTEIERSSLIPEDVDSGAFKITEEMRKKDAQAEAAARQKELEDKMPHYAGLLLNNPAASVRGVSVPYPRGGKVAITAGPPSRITLSRGGTSAATMRQFFVEALPVYKWKAAGNCWERPNPAGKTASLCVETGANSATITINEK